MRPVAGDDRPRAVVFDVGNVLYDWDIRLLYRGRFASVDALERFLAEVVTLEWHFQHDRGRPFAETSAELTALHPEHRAHIEHFGARFLDSIPGMIGGMADIVAALDARGVPLYAITNFSREFWSLFRQRESMLFDRFRGIVVSGEEGLVKPDPALFRLALDRFRLKPGEALFVDDRFDNVEAAVALGFHGHHFRSPRELRFTLEELELL